jgi:hypothetical protein
LFFAGEDTEYVDEAAELSRGNDVSLFYDMYEEAILLGKPCGASSQGFIAIRLQISGVEAASLRF